MLTSAGDISVGQRQAYMQFELRNTSFGNRLKNNNNVTWFLQTWKYHQVLVQFPFQFNARKWRVGRLRNGFIPKQTQKVRFIFPTMLQRYWSFGSPRMIYWPTWRKNDAVFLENSKLKRWVYWILISGHLWIDFTKLNGRNTVEDILTWPLDVSSSPFSYSSSKWVSFHKIPNFPISDFLFPILLILL